MCHNCECCLCVYMKRQCWLLFLCYTDTSICAARVCEASIVVPTFLPLKPEKVKITPVMPTVIHYICASQWAHQSHHMSLITISALHNFTHTHAPRAHMHTHTRARAHTHTNQVSDFYHICLHCTPRACVCLIHKHTDVAMCVWSVHFLHFVLIWPQHSWIHAQWSQAGVHSLWQGNWPLVTQFVLYLRWKLP